MIIDVGMVGPNGIEVARSARPVRDPHRWHCKRNTTVVLSAVAFRVEQRALAIRPFPDKSALQGQRAPLQTFAPSWMFRADT